MRGRSHFWIFVLLTHLLLVSFAQDAGTNVNCGDMVEGEFTQQNQKQVYIVPLSPGDKLKVGVVPIGEYLVTRFEIYDPAGGSVYYNGNPALAPVVETSVLSARGKYSVVVINSQYAGVYTLLVGCTLRDGTVIEAGVSQ